MAAARAARHRDHTEAATEKNGHTWYAGNATTWGAHILPCGHDNAVRLISEEPPIADEVRPSDTKEMRLIVPALP